MINDIIFERRYLLELLNKIMKNKAFKDRGLKSYYRHYQYKNSMDTYGRVLFPGLYLLITDVDLLHKYENLNKLQPKFFSINYFFQGKMAWRKDRQDILVGRNTLMIENTKLDVLDYDFPQGNFKAITYAFNLENVHSEDLEIFSKFGLDFMELYEELLSSEHLFIHNNKDIDYIFSPFKNNLFSDPNLYFLKLVEILLFLKDYCKENGDSFSYVQSCQKRRIYEIQAFITEDLTVHYTLEELSEIFDIPLTSMKSMFKEIYGMSIGEYLIDYKMNHAKELILTTDMNIGDIAGLVGYSNASKFTEAFKEIMHQKPSDCRKQRRRYENNKAID